MNKSSKYWVTCICLSWMSLLSYSQTLEIKGVVVDSLDHSIPFATIEIIKANDGIGVACDQEGVFTISISEHFIQDTITVNALGYRTRQIPVSDLRNDTRIQLSQKIYDLPEVVVKPGKTREIEVGHTQTSKWTGGILTKDLTQIAVLIENPDTLSGTLQTVSFYNSRSGKPLAPVRLRIYNYGGALDPAGEDLLVETVILKPYKKESWNTFDVSKYQIKMQENGMLIALEWVITDEKYWYKVDIKGTSYDCYGIVLGNTWAYEEARTYHNYLGKGWKKREDRGLENRPRNALIKATFSIFEN